MSEERNRAAMLSAPFHPHELEWRIGRSGVKNDRPWAYGLVYITNRAIMQRLDDVFTPFGWKNEYKDAPGGSGILCGISVKFGDEWVTKWDGAEPTAIESVKGGLSDSMKRAAVQWGIGRYLYEAGDVFLDMSPEKRDGWQYAKIKRSRDDRQGLTAYWRIPHPAEAGLPVPETTEGANRASEGGI